MRLKGAVVHVHVFSHEGQNHYIPTSVFSLILRSPFVGLSRSVRVCKDVTRCKLYTYTSTCMYTRCACTHTHTHITHHTDSTRVGIIYIARNRTHVHLHTHFIVDLQIGRANDELPLRMLHDERCVYVLMCTCTLPENTLLLS